MDGRRVLVVSCLAALAAGAACGARAAIHFVKPDGTGDFPTIAAAVAAAAEYDVIELADGVFSGEGNYNVVVGGGSITIGSRSRVPEACVIDAGGVPGETRRAFVFSNADRGPFLEDVTLRNGWADVEGQGGYGGAIYVENADPVIDGCIFVDNQAWRGGAVFMAGDAGPTFLECWFEHNQADGFGGAAMNAMPTSMGSFFHCTFRENSALMGGALACWNANDPTIWYTTFHGNSATSGGAHLYLRWDSRPTVTFCLFTSSQQGSAVLIESGTTLPDIVCSDIWNNAGGDWTDLIAPLETLYGNLTLNPRFCDAGSGDFHLQANSPCLAGSPENPSCETMGAWPASDCAVTTRVCCLAAACYILEAGDCEAIGGDFVTDPLFWSCDPNPCPVGAVATSWGALKSKFITPAASE